MLKQAISFPRAPGSGKGGDWREEWEEVDFAAMGWEEGGKGGNPYRWRG